MGIGGWIADSLSAVWQGLAGSQTLAARAMAGSELFDQARIENLYRTSWLARKIHDVPPYDMTRAWRAWQADKAQIKAIEAEERRLKLRWKVRRALTLARLYGGGALILGLPGNPNEAAAPDGVAKGKLGFVHAVSRHQLQVAELETDPMNPRFGEPRMYRMSGGVAAQVEVHPSRVIPFVGQPLPEGMMNATVDSFWGDPLLQSLFSAINNSEQTQRAISELLDEAKVDIISIPNLMEMVGSSEYEARLMKRLTIAQGIKKSSGALLISAPATANEAGEKWETRQLSFAGLPELAKLALQVASGGADIPATRLLGQSPDGQNATGESDLRNYYDMLSGRQSTDLTPSLDPVDDMLIRSALGTRPDEIYYEWSPLWQLTPAERAEIGDKKAKAVKVYADSGLLPTRALEEGLQNMLIEDGLFPGLEGVLDDMPPEERFPSLAMPDEPEEKDDPLNPVGPNDPNSGDPAAAVRQAPAIRRAAANDARFTDATPRTLYVSRKVLNSGEIIAWAKAQGFTTTLDGDDLHVTVAFSRAPVDWMEIAAEWAREENGNLTVSAGGPRIVERLGDKGAVVLMFSSGDLQWRHQDILRSGATWDWDSYQPHITLTYDAPDGLDLETVEPYRGAIHLGPEIFEEVVEDWEKKINETAA